jgi:hypothetical protein
LPTGFTYATYEAAVVTQIPTIVTDPNFVTMLPNAIDYAELSIMRDLDFLAMKGAVALGNLTVGNNTLPLATTIVVAETVYYSGGVVTPASQDYILTVYAGAANGPPLYWAPIGNAAGSPWTPALEVLFGPAADITYAMTAYCSQRAAPLSSTNTTTFISLNLPDLFWAAGMIFWAGYLKSFGSQSDDPRMAVSWTAEYQRLLKGAQVEQARLKFMSQGWQAMPPTQIAQPRT